MKRSIFILSSMFIAFSAMAQFDSDGGTLGSKAIGKTDPSIKAWAKGVELSRSIEVTYGKPYDAVGTPAEDNLRVVSLGNSGTALVTFDRPIINDYGYDFVVFENAFDSTFMELAFVEVSSNGKDFFRFPSESSATEDKTTQTTSHYKNLAGKYSYNYGVGFDLDELEDNALLDKNNIRFVRLVDVNGGVDKDSKGNIIYEYNETVWLGSSGFDLAGIGVINGGQAYEIADFNTLLADSNTYEIASQTNNDIHIEDEDMYADYFLKFYKDNGLVFPGKAENMYEYNYSWGLSNVNDTAVCHATANSGTTYSKEYYTSAALSGADGLNGYLQGYYSSFSGPDHMQVYKEDSSAFYPVGVYVSQSLDSYLYAKQKNLDDGWFKVIAKGYDAQGTLVGSVEKYLINMSADDNGNVLGNRNDWMYMDLSSLGKVSEIKFSMDANYTNSWGVEISTYLMIDNFTYTNEEIAKVTPQTVQVNACDSYELNGHTFTESGIYGLYDTILDLTVNYSVTDTVTIEITTAELPYEFEGNTYEQAGTYTIEGQTAEGCDSTIVLVLNMLNSIENNQNAQISVYPNPATDVVNIAVAEISNVKVIDMQGRIVVEKENVNGLLQLNNLQQGSYFVNITSDNNTITKQLIVK